MMTLTLPRLLIAFTALLLSACTSQKSSPERRAKHAIYQMAREDFSPEIRTQIPDSIKASIPFFDQFYQMGKADRAKGLTRQQAEQREAYFRSPEFLSDVGKKGKFINQEYSVDNPQKQRQILLDSAVATYWDGYDGRP
ncbi:Exc2 family lipoprotein [Serratia proteamaculans]|uniref:Exc2 family lipoprotein n=1 Tax=Serratia proteamaculans TaxID=28151 RepID=UPI0021BD3799|nr:Exc2 family lipoprotein [Serratia proteamaculans]